MSDMATDYQRRPITADEFDRMADLGIFDPDERLELVDGEIILMPPMNPPHYGGIARLTYHFVRRLDGRAIVSPQLPLRISERSTPMPDFSILRPRDDFYATRRPTIDETIAIVECSDSSLRYDRGKKLSAYARAGVREYWIVNLEDLCVEVHREPHELGYRQPTIVTPGESISFSAICDVSFAVSDLVGPIRT